MTGGVEKPTGVGRAIDSVGFSLASLGTGVVGAWLLPGHPLGLNLLLTFAAAGLAVVVARPRVASFDSLMLAAASLTLVGTAIIRDAQWVVAVSLVGATGLALLAVTGISSWTQMIRDGFYAGLRSIEGVALALRPLSARLGHLQWERVGSAARGTLIAAMLLIVFGTLFLTADRAFAQLASDVVVVDLDLTLLPARMVVALILVSGTGALVLSGRATGGVRPPLLLRAFGIDTGGAPLGPPTPRKLQRTEWVTPLVLLDLLFAAFVAVQIAVLFGGKSHVLETAGLTYAEYARSGFFQLCAVGAGALAVVGGTAHFAARRTKGDDVLLRILLGLLMALTVVVLLSALRRLHLYETAFGYTRLRLAVHATILWMGGIIALVLVAGINLRGKWVPAAAVTLTTVAVMIFTALNPDALIARLNVERFEDSGRIDLGYVAHLSADAAGELRNLPAPLRDCALTELARRLEDESWVSLNFARRSARSIIDNEPPQACLGTGGSGAATIP